MKYLNHFSDCIHPFYISISINISNIYKNTYSSLFVEINDIFTYLWIQFQLFFKIWKTTLRSSDVSWTWDIAVVSPNCFQFSIYERKRYSKNPRWSPDIVSVNKLCLFVEKTASRASTTKLNFSIWPVVGKLEMK